MVDFATLSLGADTRGLDKGVKSLENVTKAGAEAERSTERVGKGFTKAGRDADRAGRIFSGVAGTLKSVAGLAAAAGAALGTAFSLSGAVSEARDFETSMFRIDAIIRATGGAAGKSAEQLREQARQIAFSTLESTKGVMQAQQTLLTFRKIQGDVFDRTLHAAADMTAALGGDLNSATIQLARALEDPAEGLNSLSRSLKIFTPEQKEMVKGMVEAGDTARAHDFILSQLEARYGGTAVAAASGLAGAQDTLGQAFQEAGLKFVEVTGLLAGATAATNLMSKAVMFLTDNMDTVVGTLIAAGSALTLSYARALAAATAAAGKFVIGLVSVKGALIATGIGAAVVSAGFLIGKFLELVRATGSWAGALKLLATSPRNLSGSAQLPAARTR
ncbi:MAG TPA: hypothetical protein ENN65_03985, partial [Candidatus Hydrogenedentes bacterium]|nr:hypothetical protein [Candidatus Hydrogenedentota bacterium]